MLTMRARARMNPAAVKRPVDRANFKNLHHVAATIRKTARRSIRRRKKASEPGRPPHTQGQLKKSILYDVDKQRQVAVIGPAAHLISGVAAAHEHGRSEPADPTKRGTANWRIQLGGHGPIRKGRNRRGGRYQIIKIRTPRQLAAVEEFAATLPIKETGFTGRRDYPQRPFMGPALNEHEDRIPNVWRGSVRS